MFDGRDDESDSRSTPAVGDGGPRPKLLSFITMLLLFAGMRSFFVSATELHALATGKPEVLVVDGTRDVLVDTAARSQVILANALQADHKVAVFGYATVRLALALLYLFTVAAVFSKDRRGRRLGEACGLAGLLAGLIEAVFLIKVVKAVIPGILPTMATAFAEDAAKAGREPLPSALFLDQAQTFLVWMPLVVTLFGALFSLLILGYFRSIRLRLFYNEAG